MDDSYVIIRQFFLQRLRWIFKLPVWEILHKYLYIHSHPFYSGPNCVTSGMSIKHDTDPPSYSSPYNVSIVLYWLNMRFSSVLSKDGLTPASTSSTCSELIEWLFFSHHGCLIADMRWHFCAVLYILNPMIPLVTQAVHNYWAFRLVFCVCMHCSRFYQIF